MTTELLVMNKTAVALAADSAITVTGKNKQKIYNTANKLFSLSTNCPVGIMIYGNAEINGVPWETIIKIYKNKFFKQQQETLDDYANNFIAFLNDNDGAMYKSMFPDEQQNFSFGVLVFRLFSNISKAINDTINNMAGIADEQTAANTTIRDEIIKATIKMYLKEYKSLSDLDGMTESFGKDVVEKYSEIIQFCKEEVFKDQSISTELNDDLVELCAKLAHKDKFITPSGVVIAGFGELDVFPSYVYFTMDAVINNKLKYKKSNYISIDNISHRSHLRPFAQSDTVSTFVFGIDPAYEDVIQGYMKDILTDSYPSKIIEELNNLSETEKVSIRENLIISGNKIYKDFIEKCRDHCNEHHFEPITQALEFLPKDELATVAESLVNITSFMKRMSMEDETVGGPCDVAVISKGDGFIWIKRKHYFEAESNPQYLARYYKR